MIKDIQQTRNPMPLVSFCLLKILNPVLYDPVNMTT